VIIRQNRRNVRRRLGGLLHVSPSSALILLNIINKILAKTPKIGYAATLHERRLVV
jgi:hypothetical protein